MCYAAAERGGPLTLRDSKRTSLAPQFKVTIGVGSSMCKVLTQKRVLLGLKADCCDESAGSHAKGWLGADPTGLTCRDSDRDSLGYLVAIVSHCRLSNRKCCTNNTLR